MYKYILIFVILCIPKICFSATSIWIVSKDNNYLYLGGTIHMLKPEDYPLPVEFSEAFSKADHLILEADIGESKSDKYVLKMTKMLTYPVGDSLDKNLDKNTWSRLSAHLSSRGLSINNVANFKPAMVVLMLTVMELNRIGMTGIGVDEYFYEKALAEGKSLAYFETVDTQLGYILSMGIGRANDLILSTLDDVSRMEVMMATMKSAWKKGDETKLADAGLTVMMKDYPMLYQQILVDRNNNWMPKIEEMLSNQDVELVLVGALHLVGNDGLLQLLRNKGYLVKQKM
ncbi:MAG: TraB/GumN family protein [Thiohalomonadales bacterium]